MESRTAKREIFVGILIGFFSLLIVIESLRMPTYKNISGLYSAPGLVPFILAIALLILSVSKIISGLLNRKKQATIEVENKKIDESHEAKAASLKRALMAVIFMLVYFFVFLGRLPYVVSTFLFLFVFQLYFAEQKTKKTTLLLFLIATVTALVTKYVFSELFLIRMP